MRFHCFETTKHTLVFGFGLDVVIKRKDRVHVRWLLIFIVFRLLSPTGHAQDFENDENQ